MKELSVWAVDGRLMPALHLEGARRFVGRVFDQATGYPPVKDPVKVPAIGEYVRAIQEGDLRPADQETADFCGVKFGG